MYLVTFDLRWHWKVKSRSFGVYWAVDHTRCIIKQWSRQAERPLCFHMIYIWKTYYYSFFLCFTYVSSVRRSSRHFGTPGFNIQPRTPQNEQNIKYKIFILWMLDIYWNVLPVELFVPLFIMVIKLRFFHFDNYSTWWHLTPFQTVQTHAQPFFYTSISCL